MARATPMPATTKASSPIWASMAATGVPISADRPNRATMKEPATALAPTMMTRVASTDSGCCTRMAGSNIMPAVKNSNTANASRSGTIWSAARRPSGCSAKIIPASRAPRASGTPNSPAAPHATPRAMAKVASRTSSRDPARPVLCRTHGITRSPTTIMKPIKAAILTSVRANVPPAPIDVPSIRPKKEAKGS